MIKFTIYGAPTPKARPRFTKRGFAYTDKKTKEAEGNFLAQAVKYKPKEPLTGALKVVIGVYKPKPKSKPKKCIHWTTKPDLDNFIKLLDCLNGIFWKDDAQIKHIEATKEYGEPARTEIEIYVV